MSNYVFFSTGLRAAKPRLRLLSLAMAFPWPAFAATEVVLPPVVVTAARLEQRLGDTFAAVTVLQRSDIEASQAHDLATLLRQQPGVEIVQQGGYGTQASAFMRGGESRHTLVIIDGVPVSTLNFGLAPLEHLMLANVERIEIARGNLSSLYGSSALGGVIQIFTNGQVKGLQASASVTASRYDTLNVKAAVANRVGDWAFGVDAAGLRSQGFNATDQTKIAGTNPDTDGYRNNTFGAFAEYGQGPWGAELRVRRSQGLTEYDSQFGPATQTDESRFHVDTASFALRHKSATFSNEVRLTGSDDDLRADVTAFPYYVKTKTQQAGWNGLWAVAPGHRLSAAVEQAKSRISSDTTYANTSRTQDTARIGYNGDAGKHQWQANVRYDSYSDFGDATTGLLGYGFQIVPSLRASFTIANGFNAPNFNDLFAPFGGNPLLKREHSLNRDLALTYDDSGLSGRVTLFHSRYRDLIANDAFFNRVNIGQARVRGVELAASFDLAGFRIAPSATFQDARDTATDTYLPRRARKSFSLSTSTQLQGFRIGADVHGSGFRYDRVGNVNALERYVTLDLMAQTEIAPSWTLQFALRNATNEEYETARGYRQPGRVGSVTLSYAMK